MKNIVVIDGPAKDNIPRLQKVLEIYEEGDKIVTSRFSKAYLTLFLGKNYENVKEKPADTIDNAFCVKPYLDPEEEVVLVTSDYHMKRASGIFEKVLGREVTEAPAEVETPEHYRLFEPLQRAGSGFILMFNPTKEQYKRLAGLTYNITSKLREHFKG